MYLHHDRDFELGAIEVGTVDQQAVTELFELLLAAAGRNCIWQPDLVTNRGCDPFALSAAKIYVALQLRLLTHQYEVDVVSDVQWRTLPPLFLRLWRERLLELLR